jgi:hypothetical protein
MHAPLARRLFDVGFMACWGELSPASRESLIASIEAAITAPTTPTEVLLELLALAEYMERRDQQLPLNIRMLGDIATLTGGTLISEDLGLKLESLDLSHLGRAKKITVDKNETTIVQGAGKQSDVQARVQQLRQQIENTESEYDREKLQERLAKLTGGVAIVSVGAGTEAEMKQKKARVEDALHATRAAVEHGVWLRPFRDLVYTMPPYVTDDEDIARIAGTYHNWRNEGGNYEDVAGFCASVPVERVAELDYVLTPGRYVGLADEEDDFDFKERFTTLRAEFEAQLKEEAELNARILANLDKIELPE